MKLNLLPLHLQNGQTLDYLPGLYVAAPPRRPARGRHAEHLIIYLVLDGNLPLSRTQESQLLERMAQIYYQRSGSATTVLRSTAESLNTFLFERNLKNSSSGKQRVGYLALVTLRGDHLYVAQSGPIHVYLFSQDSTQHIFDPDSMSRGLGVSQVTPLRFAQAHLNSNDMLFMTASPAPGLNLSNLASWRSQPFESILARLRTSGPVSLQAVLAQAVSGEGIELIKPTTEAAAPVDKQVTQPPTPLPEGPGESAPTATSQPMPEAEISPAESPVEISQSISPPVDLTAVTIDRTKLPDREPKPAGGTEKQTQASLTTSDAEDIARQKADPDLEKPSKQRGSFSQIIGRGIKSAARSLGMFFSSVENRTGSLARKILPGEDLFTLPTSVMLFFAIAIPLVVVAIASVVYFRRGRGGEYEALYMQAIQASNDARNQTEPATQREAWKNVINLLNQSTAYQDTVAAQTLGVEAQNALDQLDLIQRLDFQPAVGGNLPANAIISRLSSVNDNLYLLNTTSDNVLRALKITRGYELDETFRCGSDYLTEQVSTLIDIAPGAMESGAHAPVYILDDSGGIMRCMPGEMPEKLAVAPPVEGWAKPAALTISLGHTFILDPGKNAVWLYRNSNFSAQPMLIFDVEIPPMQDVIDLAVDRDDLYLLHQDGHLTICGFSLTGASPTHCNDPVLYTDTRPGNEAQPLLPEEAFTQIQATEPPDPSLYLLQPGTHAIYHFSLRLLAYHRQLQPASGIQLSGVRANTPVSTFTIDSDARLAFLAFGNQVYYAAIP